MHASVLSSPSSSSSPEAGSTAGGRPGLTTPKPYTPPRCDVPVFPPIRAGGRGGKRLLRRTLRRRRRSVAAVLTVTAAALAVSAAHGAAPRHLPAAPRGPATATTRQVTRDLVKAPVRIADAAVVALLRPGVRVDVLARARIVATGVTVVAVPGRAEVPSPAAVPPDVSQASGALVVLAVPRRTAAALSGAAASSPLAVTLC